MQLGNRNIVLTGFMGTGKSTIGRLLAQRMGRKFVDTDQIIEQWATQSIPEIFAKEGESVFREWELKVAKKLANQKNLIISTGGGFVTNPRCVELLQQNGVILCLSADPLVILARRHSNERPLLDTENPLERIKILLAQRAPIYNQFPQIDTSHQTPLHTVEKIMALLGF